MITVVITSSRSRLRYSSHLQLHSYLSLQGQPWAEVLASFVAAEPQPNHQNQNQKQFFETEFAEKKLQIARRSSPLLPPRLKRRVRYYTGPLTKPTLGMTIQIDSWTNRRNRKSKMKVNRSCNLTRRDTRIHLHLHFH